MHMKKKDARSKGLAGRALALLLIMALGALVVAGLSACGDGSDSVAGAYKFDSGSEEGMEGFTLTLNDDDTFKLAQPNPEGGEEMSITGTYTLDGDKITLKVEDGSDSEVGTVDGDKLVFETITWVKE